MTTTKCPHCGAEMLDEHIESNYFGCGSTEWYRPGHARYLFERGNDCYERQIATLQSELAKRQWQPIETATKEELTRLKVCIREILAVVKGHASKAEADPAGEHLGCSELDWSEAVDHLAMAANALPEPPKE